MFAKRFGRWLAAALFMVCIVGLAFVVAANVIFGTPGHLKRSLDDSGVYATIAENIVFEQAQQNGYTSLTDPTIRSAVNEALAPEEIQRASEQAIDGTYRWLEGETDTPAFNIDLNPLKQNIATAVSKAGVQYVRELPVCTAEQLQQFNQGVTDPFAFPCRPPGFDPAAVQQQYSQQIANRSDFIPNASLTADEVRTSSGQNPFRQLSNVPRAFQLNQKLPWIFGAGALLSAAAVLFLHQTKRQAIKTLSRALLIAGVLLLVGALIVSYLWTLVQPPEVSLGAGLDLRRSILVIGRALSSAYTRILFVSAIVYAILGIGGLIGAHFTRPKGKSPS